VWECNGGSGSLPERTRQGLNLVAVIPEGTKDLHLAVATRGAAVELVLYDPAANIDVVSRGGGIVSSQRPQGSYQGVDLALGRRVLDGQDTEDLRVEGSLLNPLELRLASPRDLQLCGLGALP